MQCGAGAASWQRALPPVIAWLGLETPGGLVAASPWVAACLPAAEAAVRDAFPEGGLHLEGAGFPTTQKELKAEAENRKAALVMAAADPPPHSNVHLQ